MMLRKINSCLTLVAAALFAFHAGIMSLLLSGVIPYRPWYPLAGRGLLTTVAAHAALSMFIFFMNMEDNKDSTLYVRINKATVMQRVLAIVTLFMAVVHIQDGVSLWGGQVVYIAAASAHIALSLPRALLTVGAVGTAGTYKRLQTASMLLGIVITAWAAVSYGMYAMTGS